MAGEATEVLPIAAAAMVSFSTSQLRSPSPGTLQLMVVASPTEKGLVSMRSELEETEDITRQDPQDEWLPITESRNGNACCSAVHTLSSGIGFQALLLPVAFIYLGWTWGILCLILAFCWQLYTTWLLTQLHESVPGRRYSRYLHLAMAVFGPKLGKCLALLPIMYLSTGTCSALIVTGSSSMKHFFDDVCGPMCQYKSPTTIEWYLIFVCIAVTLAQLPNLNSIAGISLIGAVTAIIYCTLIWVVSVTQGRQPGVSYNPVKTSSKIVRVLDILNAFGIIAFAFRGHNLVLEIQGTMPSTWKHPAHVPMWKGVKAAYLLIACCVFPVAIAGFWAYGNLIPPNGILTALYSFHSRDTSRVVLRLTTLLVIINCLSSFQIYAMPVFDNLESRYTSRNNRPCPRWIRSVIRAFVGLLALFISVALPFLPELAGLLGAIALPVTLAYPCFMWIVIKKPTRCSAMWYINWCLGSLGTGLSVMLTVGGLWRLVDKGLKANFFKPHM